MDLENILRQKATAKEAERAKQQKEQETALAEAERLQKQEAEESRLVGLRESITDIDTKTGQMQSLLAELKQAHEQAKASVGGAKKEGQDLTKATAEVNKLFSNEQFRALLADEGIESLDDLLQAEEYSEQEQVKSVKGLKQSRVEKRQTAREQIGTRRQVKVEAHKAITTERPDVPQKLTYKNVVVALEELVQDFGNERKKLYYQTPEGQEARRQEIKSKVAKRHERGGAYYSLLDNNLDRNDLVDSKDINDVKEYGEDSVKTALVEVWSDHVDTEIERNKKQAGLDVLSQDLEALRSSENRMSEARQAVRMAEVKRVELARHLIELCNSNPDNLKRLNNYHGGYSKSAEQAVNFYLDHLDDLEHYRNNFAWAKDYINKYDPESQKRRGLFDQSGRSGRGDNWQTTMPNPDYFIDVAKKAEEFYQVQIQENQERVVLPNEKEKDKAETIVAKKSDDWRQGEAFVYVDKKTEELLKRQNLDKASEDVRKNVGALEAVGSKAKEKLKVKLEKDWTERESGVYSTEHRDAYDISQQKEKIDRLKQQAKEGEKTLALEKIKLSDRLQERVTIERSRYSGNDYFITTLDLNKEQEKDQKELERFGQELNLLTSQISTKTNEDKGLFGRKEKKIAEELRVLQEQKKTKEQEISMLRQQVNQRSQQINEIGGLFKIINVAELGSNYTDREITVGELMDDLTSKLQELQQKQLTPEQQQVFDEYSRLKKKAETAKNSYDDLERKRRGY